MQYSLLVVNLVAYPMGTPETGTCELLNRMSGKRISDDLD